jgi:hypothetical protein
MGNYTEFVFGTGLSPRGISMKPVFCSLCGAPVCRAHRRGINDYSYICQNCHSMVRMTFWESNIGIRPIEPMYDTERMIMRRINDLYYAEFYD